MLGLSKKERIIASLEHYEKTGKTLLPDELMWLGYGQTKDRSKAIDRILRAAKMGHDDAIRTAYLLMISGELNGLSNEEREKLHKDAIAIRESNALMELGVHANMNGDTDAAIRYWEMAACAGNSEACNRLVSYYSNRKDPETSEILEPELFKYWIYKELTLSDGSRQRTIWPYLISVLGEDEKYSDPNSREYQQWLMSFMMGAANESTRPYNINERLIIERAEDAGCIPAIIDGIEKLGEGDDSRLAAAVAAGYPQALNLYARIQYRHGNQAEGIKNFKLASEAGYTESSMLLALIYKGDPAESLKYLLKAASHGNQDARSQLSTHPLLDDVHHKFYEFLLNN